MQVLIHWPSWERLLTQTTRLTAEERQSGKMPWLIASNLSPHQLDMEKSLPRFALNLLSRVILAQEFYLKRRSCFRIFIRMDISVFQCEGKFHYMVNELTSSQHTALFLDWGTSNMDFCIHEIARSLHFVAQEDSRKRQKTKYNITTL